MSRALIKQNDGKLPLPGEFVDFEGKSTIPAATLTNARIALAKLGAAFTYDEFKGRASAGSMQLTVGGQVSDEALSAIRVMIRGRFKFDPGKNNTWDALLLFCREHSYHPIKQYLESVQWDGTPRIDTMLCDYFGTPDTPFVRAVSYLVMVASVRRIYKPGCKFDYMTVLESPEGFGKSSALATLYGPNFFSDQSILGLDDKHLQETVRGRWAIECADLSGMRKAEVEKIKAQLSRFEDRTRPAYGRAVIDAPRSCVFWGTTNEVEYLRSQTGNRRFFPVPVSHVDVAGLRRDRDQLWAEAMACEPLAEDLSLPESLWAAAGVEQERRTYRDAWSDTLADVSEAAAGYERDKMPSLPVEYEAREDHRRSGIRVERVTSRWLLTDLMQISAGQQTAEHGKRLGMVMRSLGWRGPLTFRINGRVAKGYERDVAVPEPWECEP